MAKTYVDVGPSAARNFGYEPSGLRPGDTVICVDMPYDVGSQGVLGARSGLPTPIYPDVVSADAAIDTLAAHVAAVGDDATRRDYAVGIATAHFQRGQNMAYESDAKAAGVAYRGIHGDGRRLRESLGNQPVDEVLLHNVISDPELTEDDCLKLILGGLSAIAPSGVVVLHDTYTPGDAILLLKRFCKKKLLPGVTLEQLWVDSADDGMGKYRLYSLGDRTLRTTLRHR